MLGAEYMEPGQRPGGTGGAWVRVKCSLGVGRRDTRDLLVTGSRQQRRSRAKATVALNARKAGAGGAEPGQWGRHGHLGLSHLQVILTPTSDWQGCRRDATELQHQALAVNLGQEWTMPPTTLESPLPESGLHHSKPFPVLCCSLFFPPWELWPGLDLGPCVLPGRPTWGWREHWPGLWRPWLPSPASQERKECGEDWRDSATTGLLAELQQGEAGSNTDPASAGFCPVCHSTHRKPTLHCVCTQAGESSSCGGAALGHTAWMSGFLGVPQSGRAGHGIPGDLRGEWHHPADHRPDGS